MRSGKFAAVVASALLLCAGRAVADTAMAPAVAPAVAPASTMASMLQGMLGLVIVVAAIFAAAWLMKKVGPRARSTGMVQVVGGASVGPREKVVIVKFGQQTLLLGVAPGQVSLLHTAASDDDDGELADETATRPPAPRFIDRLRAARSPQ